MADFDCSKELKREFSPGVKEIEYCGERFKQAMPIIVALTPPEYKINPYTKKLAGPSVKLFVEDYKMFTPTNIEEFITKRMPDFTTKVEPANVESFARQSA